MSYFGTIITSPTVENWAVTHLRDWLPTYLPEVARQAGLTVVPPYPRSYTRRSQFDKFPEDQLPLITVVSPGTADRPAREGDGLYRANWTLTVGAIVSAATESATRDLAGVYGATVTTILLQHPMLNDHVHGVEWQGASHDDLPTDEQRALAAHVASFHVEVRGMLNARQGPGVPALSPQLPGTAPVDPGEWPEVEEVDIDGRVAARS